MSEKPLSQRIQEGLVLDLVSEIKALEAESAQWKGSFEDTDKLMRKFEVEKNKLNKITVDTIERAEVAESRLIEAEKLVEKWRVKESHHWTDVTLAMEIKSECADELEKALRGEAEESECISKTLMKECGCYPKNKGAEG